MSNIPKVKPSAVDSVREAYDREGIPYIETMMIEVAKKQPTIASQIGSLLHHLDKRMESDGVHEATSSYILENIGYRMFAMIKALYIQEEVNDLEETVYDVGTKNDQN